MQLSLLIPTLPSRIKSYSHLISVLSGQIKASRVEKSVEILSLMDCKRMTVGDKRNHLVELAKGKYVAFIDDDDTISRDYVSKLLEGIQYGEDVVTFCGDYLISGVKDADFKISVTCRGNYEQNNCHYRLPNHLCPVRRSIALQCKFPNTSYGEDSDYSTQINRLIKSEYHFIDKLYFYNYDPKVTQTAPGHQSKIF